MSNGNFTRVKKWLVGLTGVAMLVASISLSKAGIGFTGDAAWIGLVIAVSLTCAEFMFDSNFDEFNWTILVLGLAAYVYSIIANINGFYLYLGLEGTMWTNFNAKSVLGGIFMDVYPELAIAWALSESKVGDLLGNLVKSWKNPEDMTSNEQPKGNNNQQNNNNGNRGGSGNQGNNNGGGRREESGGRPQGQMSAAMSNLPRSEASSPMGYSRPEPRMSNQQPQMRPSLTPEDILEYGRRSGIKND